MFNPTNSNAIISKSKKLSFTFFCISGMYIKVWILSKESWSSQVISYWNYRLEKAQLLKSPKNPVSEYLRTGNILKGLKHCLNLPGSVFVRFFDHSQGKSAPSTLFQVFCISGMYIKFWILSNKIWASQVISYWNFRLERGELLKSKKKSVSEHLWTVNMLKSSKRCLNLHSSVFLKLFDQTQKKSAPSTRF